MCVCAGESSRVGDAVGGRKENWKRGWRRKKNWDAAEGKGGKRIGDGVGGEEEEKLLSGWG